MTLHIPDLTSDTPINAHELAAPAPQWYDSPYRVLFKRPFDVALVLLSLPVVLPVIVLLALTITLTGHTPFYMQKRVGQSGRAFRMWKLRTMVKDADQNLEAYLQKNPEARQEWDETQKLKNDPRITPFGRLLRKISVDELPQLLNVLNGSMSLVGPRPMMVGQEKHYHGQAYYQLRPGITGLWQVSGRNDCAFQERAAFDSTYGVDVSLKTDLQILFKTVGVVCKATGY